MFEKKLNKHLKIIRTRIKQKEELERISRYNNGTLDQVATAISKVRGKNFTDGDRQSFKDCERYRKELLQDETLISYEIFGSDATAKVKDICKNAASSGKWCQFLYFLSKETHPNNILEIGTNLGISGCYALESLKENKQAKLITMEGLPQLCEIAGDRFASIVPASKFDIREGLFDATFPELLGENIRFDLLFIDGNHQKEPTISYFKALKDRIASTAIFVFDDINWSDHMKEAWETIKNDSGVNFALDLYKQGIIIIDKEETKKNVFFDLHLAY